MDYLMEDSAVTTRRYCIDQCSNTKVTPATLMVRYHLRDPVPVYVNAGHDNTLLESRKASGRLANLVSPPKVVTGDPHASVPTKCSLHCFLLEKCSIEDHANSTFECVTEGENLTF